MSDTKSIIASRTVWGVLIALLATLLQRAGITLGAADQAQIVDLVLLAVQCAGGAYAIYGRVLATKRIGVSSGDLTGR